VDSRTQIVKAMAVIRRHHDGALLVSEYAGPDAAPFHRPLGGHVEFGEYARETVHREFQEEIGQRLTGARGTVGPPLYPVGIMELIDEAPPDLAESLR
jgi:ADP-ribose pyrophosphatase YjhB (NUDIX family)